LPQIEPQISQTTVAMWSSRVFKTYMRVLNHDTVM